MNSTFVVARRELAEKRFVIVAACAFALLTLVIPFVVRSHGSYVEALTLTSAILAAGFVLGLSIILGATVVGREMSENRLSFYFSRPLPGPAIWFGKLLASGLLVAVSLAIIIAPAHATGVRIATQWVGSVGIFTGLVVASAIVLFLLAHVLATMVRSRSGWIAVDFICAAATAAAIAAMLRLPLAAMASKITQTAIIILSVGFFLVVVAAGAWQVTKGRTDRLGNHRALSRFLWSGVTVVLLITSSYLLWALSVRPGDLTEIRSTGAGGGWVLINGRATGRGDYRPTFLIHPDGRSLRVLTPPRAGVDISRDGRTAIWIRREILSASSVEILRCRLDVAHPHAEPTGITVPLEETALSDDGTRVAAGRSNVTIYELDTGRSLGSFHVDVPNNAWLRLMFVGRDVVRLIVMTYREASKPLRPTDIFEYDLRTRALRQTAVVDGWLLSFSPDDSRMILKNGKLFMMADSRTGAPIASLGASASAAFLRDGTVIAADVHDGAMTVRRYAANGVLLGEITGRPFGDAHVSGGDEHRAIIQVRACSGTAVCAWNPVIVDLDRGVMKPPDPTLRIAIFDRGKPLPDEIICTTATGVVAWNPTTGSKRLVAGR